MTNYIIVYSESCLGYDWSALDKMFGSSKIHITKLFNRLDIVSLYATCMYNSQANNIYFSYCHKLTCNETTFRVQCLYCTDCAVYICNAFVHGYIIDFCIIEDRSIL